MVEILNWWILLYRWALRCLVYCLDSRSEKWSWISYFWCGLDVALDCIAYSYSNVWIILSNFRELQKSIDCASLISFLFLNVSIICVNMYLKGKTEWFIWTQNIIILMRTRKGLEFCGFSKTLFNRLFRDILERWVRL